MCEGGGGGGGGGKSSHSSKKFISQTILLSKEIVSQYISDVLGLIIDAISK